MKQIAPNYSYNKTTGVITLTGVNIDRDQLLLIINTTRNVTYYNFADSATTLQAFTKGANTSVTLASSVVSASSAHTNADALTIYYDDQLSAIYVGEAPFTQADKPMMAVGGLLDGFDEIRPIRIDLNTGGQIVAGTVTANNTLVDNAGDVYPALGYSIGNGLATQVVGPDYNEAIIVNGLPAVPISGTVTATDLGVKADAVATTDTGTFSVIALIKRGLQNWTSLLAKIPTLVSGRIPVDGSGVTQPVSGTVTIGNLPDATIPKDWETIGDQLGAGLNAAGLSVDVASIPAISGTVTSLAGGETPTSGTATLTNDTRWELNTEGFGHIAFEIVSSGVAWSSNGVAAQAYNGTVPVNADILAPAGIRYRHSTDTSVTPITALNNIYYNLGIGPAVGNGYGTNLVRVDGSNASSLALPTTGTRYFLFDLTTSRFALRPFFTAGSVTVKYRLYKGKHPFFSARNIIATGDGAGGAVRVYGSVSVSGRLDDLSQEVHNGILSYANAEGGDGSSPLQVTANAGNTSFFVSGPDVYAHRSVLYSSSGNGLANEDGAPVDIDNPLPISGTVTPSLPSGYSGDPYPAGTKIIPVGGWTGESDGAHWQALALTESGSLYTYSLLAPSTNLIGSVLLARGTNPANTNFTSTTPNTQIVGASTLRRVFTVFNEGAGVLYISPTGGCSTTNYQVRLQAGDYWECPEGQLSLQHHAVFATAGTARVTQVS